MPPKKSGSKPANSIQWVSVELTLEQGAEMRKTFPDADAIFDGALKLVEGGYKVTLRYDDYNKCHAAYVFAESEEHANGGMCLTSRGGSPLTALRGAVYRHFILFDEAWGNRERQVIDAD